MYLIIILFLMLVFPVGSILIEKVILHTNSTLIALIGKWFVFWSVGIRLLLAGLRQIFDPRFTAEKIFGIKEKATQSIVQELGFANLAIGVLGTLSIIHRDWVIPAAIVGGIFYGLAGIKHLLSKDRNPTRTIAMVSDLFIFLVLAGYLAIIYL